MLHISHFSNFKTNVQFEYMNINDSFHQMMIMKQFIHTVKH